MTNVELQVMFDIIVDNFNPSDEISVENSNYEMHKNWRNFLEAGFDPTLIAGMMSPADVWEYYDELIAHGAKIDMIELFSNFFEELFDESFTKENWDKLVNRGVSPDLLADRCYDDCDIADIADLEEVFTKGVSVKKTFELVSGWLKICEERPEDQVEILTWLYEHGLLKADVKEWIENHMNCYMREYIIESGSDFYEKFDVEDDGMIDDWLDVYGYQFFCEKELSDLPDAISVGKLISFFSMREIIKSCSPCSFEDFVSDYLEVGEETLWPRSLWMKLAIRAIHPTLVLCLILLMQEHLLILSIQ